MTELVRNWVLGLTAASFLTAIAMALTPKGRGRAATALVSGLVTIIVLVAPILEFDYHGFSQNILSFESSLELRAEEMEAVQESLQARIISERSATYILDKAKALGLADLEVEVATKVEAESFPTPYIVFLTGSYTEEQRRTLEAYLDGTFGIPAQRQIWSVADA